MRILIFMSLTLTAGFCSGKYPYAPGESITKQLDQFDCCNHDTGNSYHCQDNLVSFSLNYTAD